MARILRDLHLAVRTFAARPSLFIVRCLTLALVMAAGNAVLVVANAILLRPLPFADSHRLVRVYMQPPGTSAFTDANPLHPLTFVRVRELQRNFQGLEGVWGQERAVGGEGEPESMPSAAVSAGLFQLLGATAIAGRTFTEEEARTERRVVVLSHGLWSRRFGGRPDAIGSTIIIDREAYEVLGVMGPDFEPVYVRSQFWTPLPIRDGNLVNPGATFIQTVARLKDDVTIEQGESELQTLRTTIERENPRLKGWAIRVFDLRQAQYGRQSRALALLLAAVGALALVAAANLANLTLADILHRRAQLAIRSALGATRFDLVRPEILQGVIIATIGATLGMAAAVWMVPLIVTLDPSSHLDRIRYALDWRVGAAAIGLSLAVIGFAAVLPTLRIASSDIATSLTDGGRAAIGGRRHERLRQWLVATQTALALVLVSSGALVASALDRTARIDPGFDSRGVLTAQLRLSQNAYASEPVRVQFVDAVLARIRAIPGVVDASTTMNFFIPGFTFQTLVNIDGKPTPDGQPHTVLFRRVSPGYFRTLRIREIAGRTFDSRDVGGGMPAAVVSRSFANRFWPGEDPVGRRVNRPNNAPPLTVIGVVDDVYDVGYGQEPKPTIYLAYAQNSNVAAPVSLVIRTASDPTGFVAAVKSAVWDVDPAQPLSDIQLLDRFLADSLGPQRLRSVLLAIFAGIGLLIALIGIYAVTARSVAERSREVGVRLALGGQPGRVWWTLSFRALRAFGLGLLVGAGGAIAVAALLAGVFPEVASTPKFYVAPGACLVIVAGVATALLASRRITRIEPLQVLR
jgi:putative ABC transport system permease protein